MSRLLAKDKVTTSVGVVLGMLAAQRVVAFARGMIFARVMGTEQYGIYTLSFFLIPIMVLIASLGLPASFGRFIPRYEQRGAVRWFMRQTFTVTIALSTLVAAAIILAPGFFSRLLYGDPGYTNVMTLAAVCVPLMLIFRNISSTFLGLRLFRASSVFETALVVIYAVLGTAIFLIFRSAAAAVLAYAVSVVLTLALFWPVLSRYLTAREPIYRPIEDKDFYRRILRFSIWFMLTPILAQVFHYVDKLSIQRLMSASDQGVYSATAAIAGMVSAVGLAVNNVVYPHLSATWEKGDRETALWHLDLAIRVTGLVLLVIGAVVVLLGSFIINLLLGEAYAAGAAVLPYLTVFYLLTVTVWLLGVFPSLIEQTYVATIGLAIALPVNVGLNLTLIPRIGTVGAAAATMISYFVMWAIVLGLCRRYGLRTSFKTVVVSVAPFALILPEPLPLVVACALAVLGLVTPLFFTAAEKELARDEVVDFVRRLRSRSRTKS
jgi:O-antigen/teichoic acid export membrane protein